MEARTDCPDCRSAGSVERGVCQVCFAELPPALRFADVVAELESVAALDAAGATGNVAEACRRARAMLERLRGEFMADVILAPPGVPPVPEACEPDPSSTVPV